MNREKFQYIVWLSKTTQKYNLVIYIFEYLQQVFPYLLVVQHFEDFFLNMVDFPLYIFRHFVLIATLHSNQYEASSHTLYYRHLLMATTQQWSLGLLLRAPCSFGAQQSIERVLLPHEQNHPIQSR